MSSSNSVLGIVYRALSMIYATRATRGCKRQHICCRLMHYTRYGTSNAISLEVHIVAVSFADAVVGIQLCRAPPFQFCRRGAVRGLCLCTFCFAGCCLHRSHPYPGSGAVHCGWRARFRPAASDSVRLIRPSTSCSLRIPINRTPSRLDG